MTGKPTDLPSWATSPPGDTITEPTAPQRAEGFQPRRKQLEHLTITTVADSTLYRATINAVNHDFTSGIGATAEDIRDGLRAAIDAGSEPVTTADDGTDALTIEADVAGVAFTLTVTANITRTTTTTNLNGRPRRQHMNWLFNLIYLCLSWLFQTVDQLGELLFNDQPTDVGTPPAIGAGLVKAAGFFSGGAVVNGNLVSETDSPAVTLAANSRHYWDLGDDAVWTHITTALADPDPEPAVTADSTRVYVFTTDGAGIDAVTNPGPARARFRGGVRIYSDTGPLIDFPVTPSVDVDEVMHIGFASASFVSSDDMLGLGPGVGFVTNARYIGGQWVRTDGAQPALLRVFTEAHGIAFFSASVIAAGADWPNTIGSASWVQGGQVDETFGVFDAAVRMQAPTIQATTEVVAPLATIVDLVVTDDAGIAGDLEVDGTTTLNGPANLHGGVDLGGTVMVRDLCPLKFFEPWSGAVWANAVAGGGGTAPPAGLIGVGTFGIGVAAANGGISGIVLPLEVPDFVSLDALILQGDFNAPTATDVRVAIYRQNSTGVVESLKVTEMTNVATGTGVSRVFSIDQNATVNNSTFSYFAYVYKAVNGEFNIYGAKIRYYMSALRV